MYRALHYLYHSRTHTHYIYLSTRPRKLPRSLIMFTSAITAMFTLLHHAHSNSHERSHPRVHTRCHFHDHTLTYSLSISRSVCTFYVLSSLSHIPCTHTSPIMLVMGPVPRMTNRDVAMSQGNLPGLSTRFTLLPHPFPQTTAGHGLPVGLSHANLARSLSFTHAHVLSLSLSPSLSFYLTITSQVALYETLTQNRSVTRLTSLTLWVPPAFIAVASETRLSSLRTILRPPPLQQNHSHRRGRAQTNDRVEHIFLAMCRYTSHDPSLSHTRSISHSHSHTHNIRLALSLSHSLDLSRT